MESVSSEQTISPYEPTGRRISIWLWILASCSAGYALACTGFYFQYYVTYGFFPHPDSQPEATQVNFPLLNGAIVLLLLAQFITVPLSLVVLGYARSRKTRLSILVRLYIWTALGAAFIATYGGFLDWFFD
ncbi:hypothetical protein [Hymenobacter armeniacus]|uniref:Uncharacterized protein n=1 Tax=Hymenobacter armeniacus TaxID=2771358 RepID=A0ABR8JUI6_9BACT|nr:hypothetical protein [Hymenobacter armeniacus]MBD2723630.1 hypothetical protein [Hymenobacter armeniacus]